jgi:hypothetical protein
VSNIFYDTYLKRPISTRIYVKNKKKTFQAPLSAGLSGTQFSKLKSAGINDLVGPEKTSKLK